MINIDVKSIDDDLEITVGNWQVLLPETDLEGYLELHQEAQTIQLYEWIGLELHAVQQGVSDLFYMNNLVHAESMADTVGAPVIRNTQLNIGGVVVPVFVVAQDESVEWPKAEEIDV